MKADLILFATDFSKHSEAALACASNLAQTSGATLLIVHVHPLQPAQGEGMLHAGVYPQETADLRVRLQEVTPTLPDVPFEHELLVGDPAAEIVDLATREKADMIVIGTHGRTGLLRLLMGSTAEKVVRRAPCPVVTVKTPQPENASEADADE
jgi:universal stress protein A